MLYWSDVDDDGEMSVGTALAALAAALVDGGILDEGGHPDARVVVVDGVEAAQVPPALPAPRQPETRPALPRRR
jgi:hypothetical protein